MGERAARGAHHGVEAHVERAGLFRDLPGRQRVFEGNRRVRMEHDGRFQMGGEKSSKLSAVLIVLPEHVVCFENPGAAFPLAEGTRLCLVRFPWFDLKHSVLEWQMGDVERQLELDRQMITRLDARFDDIRWG